MPESPERSLNRVRLLNQLQKLAAQLDPAWLAVVSHPELEACRVAFRFECPTQWEQLAPPASPKVRHCESCQQYVHYCTSLTEARYHAANGHCVAVSLALARRPDDLTTSPPRLAPDRVGHHSVAGRLEAPRLTLGFAIPDVPRPTLARQWDPEPKQPREPQQPKSRRRKKRRTSHRNLQRENWEEVE